MINRLLHVLKWPRYRKWGPWRLEVEWYLAIFNISLNCITIFCWTEPQRKVCHLPEVTPVKKIILNVLMLQGICYTEKKSYFRLLLPTSQGALWCISTAPSCLGCADSSLCKSLAAGCKSVLKGDCFKVAFSLFLLLFLQILSLQQRLLSQLRQSKQMCHYLMWWASPLNKSVAPPWQVVLDALLKPSCKNSLNPPGNGNEWEAISLQTWWGG